MNMTVDAIAALIQGTVIGDGSVLIKGITNIEQPAAGLITFIDNPKYLSRLENSGIACLIVPPQIERWSRPVIQVAEPKRAWARLLRHAHPLPLFSGTVSELASIDPSAKLGKAVTVEPFALIAEGAEIGDGTVVSSQVRIGRNVKIGAGTVIHAGVVVYEECFIGERVILHAGTVIGADGFGYVSSRAGHEKVPQVGNVVIENDVEIGACATIDRATIGSTRIGQGCKLDNMVQIAHNVSIGPNTVISAQTGISGSSRVGAFVTMGGKVGLGDHVEIGDGTMVGAGSGFPSGKKVPAGQIVFGEPARPYHLARKQIAAQLKSAEMLDSLRSLKKRVEELEKQLEEFRTHQGKA